MFWVARVRFEAGLSAQKCSFGFMCVHLWHIRRRATHHESVAAAPERSRSFRYLINLFNLDSLVMNWLRGNACRRRKVGRSEKVPFWIAGSWNDAENGIINEMSWNPFCSNEMDCKNSFEFCRKFWSIHLCCENVCFTFFCLERSEKWNGNNVWLIKSSFKTENVKQKH